jgi:putative addiction module component (TIGR02574 family)
MDIAIQELLQTALQLPENVRADLAASLIESLDQPFDAAARDAWAAEIGRRVAEIDAGTVSLVSWNDARQTIANAR